MTVIIIAVVALVAIIGLGLVKKTKVVPPTEVALTAEVTPIAEVAPTEVVQPKNGKVLEPQLEMVVVPQPTDGFAIGLENIPKGATKWTANFGYETFSYEPTADSGWLSIVQIWKYPGDPKDVMTLQIWVIDANDNTLLKELNLGPVRNRTNYVFDCGTRILKVREGGIAE